MPGGGTLCLRAENVLPEKGDSENEEIGPMVKVSIQDEGCGIPEKHLPNIFDPFFTTKEKGRGLGLSTSFSIVTRHGGRLLVDSREGGGTIFQVFLPASPEKCSPPREDNPVPLRRGEGRVLLVDDEEIVRNAAAHALERMGYEVEVAGEGAEGVRIYGDAMGGGRPFDAVIMDLTIPGGMGGREAIERFLQVDPGARVIVSSGYSDDPIMANYRDYGFSGVAVKPYRMEEMNSILQQVMDEPRDPLR